MGSIVVSFGEASRDETWDMKPVSAVDAVSQEASAMRVVKSAMHDGAWIYQQEVPLLFGSAYRMAEGPGGTVDLPRLEAKSYESLTRLQAGDQLVVAIYPPEICRVGVARFKPALPEGVSPPPIGADVAAWLDALDYDPWEMDGLLTAAPRLHRPVQDRAWQATRGLQRHVLGICPRAIPIEEIVAEIALAPVVRAASDRLKADKSLVDLAILQALAGPPADSIDIITTPVADAAADLLEGHAGRRSTRG